MAEVYQRYDLFKKLETLNSHFDSEATIRLGFNSFGIKDKDGSYLNCGGFGGFCKTWCEKYGEFIDFSTKGSFQSGKLFYMTWKNLDKVEKQVGGVKSAVQEQKETKQVEDVSEKEEGVEVTATVSTEQTSTSEQSEIDWDWISTLKNNKYGKQDLEDYAKPFGIDLKKNKSLQNMIIDFKKHVGVSVE